MTAQPDPTATHEEKPVNETSPTTTPAIERAAETLLPPARMPRTALHVEGAERLALAALTAALDAPAEPDYGSGMDTLTLDIHSAICADGPRECLEWRGDCVRASEAARTHLLGGAA